MTCKYVSMYKFYQSSGLLCISEDLAQVFCYTHKIFQKFDVREFDVQDRSQPDLDFMKCEYCRCK
jgi:hypothetical protein